MAALALVRGPSLVVAVMPAPARLGSGAAAQLLEQRAGDLGEELLLGVAADLHERDVGEPGLPERPDALDDRVEVGSARDVVGDVLGPDELRRRRRTRPSSAGRR